MKNVFFLLMLLSVTPMSKSQEIEIIENSVGYSGFLNHEIFIHENLVVFRYLKGSSYELGIFNNGEFKNFDIPLEGTISSSIPCSFKGKVYFIFLGTDKKAYLVEFDGSNIRVFPSPDELNSNFDNLVVFDNNLYFCCASSAENSLAKFDGAKIELIPNPTDCEIISWKYLVYGNELLVRNSLEGVSSFNGNSFTHLNLPTNGRLAYVDPFIYKDNVYIVCQIPGNAASNYLPHYALSKLNGTNFEIVDDFKDYPEAQGILGQPFIFNDTLYFQYVFSGGNARLAKYDGDEIIIYPNKGGEVDVCGSDFFVFNGKLYFSYLSTEGNKIAHLNENDEIETISGMYMQGTNFTYNDTLYFATSIHYHLAKLNGQNIEVLTGGTGGVNRSRFKIDDKVYFTLSNLWGWGTFKENTNTFTHKIKEKNLLSLYPNPTNAKCTINLNSQNIKVKKLVIYNNLGRVVKTINYHKKVSNINQIEFDVSSFAAGTYYVSLISDTHTVMEKFIVEK